MMYTIKLKTRGNTLNDGGETIKVEADDVNLTTAETETEHGTIETPLDYNFLNGEKSVARIPFENVWYIAKL
jgi:hypothetical protein